MGEDADEIRYDIEGLPYAPPKLIERELRILGEEL
jgi:hypothetical protein